MPGSALWSGSPTRDYQFSVHQECHRALRQRIGVPNVPPQVSDAAAVDRGVVPDGSTSNRSRSSPERFTDSANVTLQALVAEAEAAVRGARTPVARPPLRGPAPYLTNFARHSVAVAS